MLRLMIVFAWSAAIIPVREAYSISAQDLQSILKILQHQQKAELQQDHKYGGLSSSSDDRADNDRAQFGSLKKQNLLSSQLKKDVRGIGHANREEKGNERYNNQLLGQLMSKIAQAGDKKKPQKYDVAEQISGRIQPHDLLDLNFRDENARTKDMSSDLGDLSDYSKIYVVLNPEAVQNSKSKNALRDMVAKVLAMSSKSNQKARYSPRPNKKYYKGFAVNEDMLSKRARRYSKEDSEEHRPKRARNDYGGGGARTAIPYIRHRGDVYEKDH